MRPMQRVLGERIRFKQHERQKIIWQSQVAPPEKLVLLAFNEDVDALGYSCPSVNEIARMTGMSRSTALRTLKTLQKRGFISIDNIFIESRQTTNDYVVNFEEIDEATKKAVIASDEAIAGGVKMTPSPPCQNDTPPHVKLTPLLDLDHDPDLDLDPDQDPDLDLGIEIKKELDQNTHNPDPDPDARDSDLNDFDLSKGKSSRKNAVPLQSKKEASLSVEINSVGTDLVPPQILPVDNFRASIDARTDCPHDDYFEVWHVLYRQALVWIGRSGESVPVARRAWSKRFSVPIPARRISGGLEAKEAVKAAVQDHSLLEPIEEFCERVRLVCGDKSAAFVLGDHWHRVRMKHSSLKGKAQKNFCTDLGLDFGTPVCGVKSMTRYLESSDAESSWEWIQMLKSQVEVPTDLSKYFD